MGIEAELSEKEVSRCRATGNCEFQPLAMRLPQKKSWGQTDLGD
jgi:hypothetical protein